MHSTMLWLYLGNATLLIVHEVDSAYWKEWRLLWDLLGDGRRSLPDSVGAPTFVALHLPLVAVVLWGLLEVARKTAAGLVMSIVLGVCGVFAFSLHFALLRKGHPEFRSIVSQIVLWSALGVSIAQLAASAASLVG